MPCSAEDPELPSQDKKNVDIPKTKNTTAPAQAGYIMEYEHGQVRNGTVVIQGNECALSTS